MKLGLGNVYRDIEEMVDLCDELFDSDIWEDSSTTAIDILVATSANIKESPDRQIVLEKVTSYLRKSIMRLPDLHLLSTALATLLLLSFERSPMGLLLKILIVRSSFDFFLASKDFASMTTVLRRGSKTSGPGLLNLTTSDHSVT